MLWDHKHNVLQMVPGSFYADAKTAASYRIDGSNLLSNAVRVFATGQPYLSNAASGESRSCKITLKHST